MNDVKPQACTAVTRVAGLRWSVLVLAAVSALAVAQGTSGNAAPARPQAAGATAEEGTPWAALTVSQQQALAPLKPEWARIDAPRKRKWLDLATRMPTLSAAENERIQQRMTEWVRMSPAERGRARLQFLEAKRLPPDQLQERWKAYQALPSDQRQALASQTQRKAGSSADRETPAAQPVAATAASPEVKRNIVRVAPAAPAPKTVAPTVVQSRPGATTSLVTSRPTPPLHQQAGLPKVNASAGFVDPETLLPRRGPQGAAAMTTPAAGKP